MQTSLSSAAKEGVGRVQPDWFKEISEVLVLQNDFQGMNFISADKLLKLMWMRIAKIELAKVTDEADLEAAMTKGSVQWDCMKKLQLIMVESLLSHKSML